MNAREIWEAQHALDLEKCARFGHGPFTVAQSLGAGGAPTRVTCDRCGSTWAVAR